MDLKKYNYFTNDDFLDYEFYSEGPKGRIKKVVNYQRINENPVVYNLAFGDFNKETGTIDDVVNSNKYYAFNNKKTRNKTN